MLRRGGEYLPFFFVVFVCLVLILFYRLVLKMEFKEMKVNLKEELTISLEAIPTTGYTWGAEFDKNFLKLKGEIFEPYPPETIGGGGKVKFIFIPIKTGKTDIIMRYKRPWEKEAIEEKTFRIIITE